jgi:hypothetical protein
MFIEHGFKINLQTQAYRILHPFEFWVLNLIVHIGNGEFTRDLHFSLDLNLKIILQP